MLRRVAATRGSSVGSVAFGLRFCSTLKALQMPALSPTMEAGTIAEWKKQPGDTISIGDVYCRIETDKAVLEFENTSEEGFLAKILVAPGGRVSVGTPIAVLAEDEADIKNADSFVVDSPAQQASVTAATPSPASPAAQTASEPKRKGDLEKSGPAAQRIARGMSSEQLAQAEARGKGGRFTKADLIAFDGSASQGSASPASESEVVTPTPTKSSTPTPSAPPAAKAPAASGSTTKPWPGVTVNFAVKDDAILKKLFGINTATATK
jgi:pyruvate dehydrogenase E2 component (dihydrolipoamide acetyltransferase)